jgi:Domain of unknown function (DUF4112)
MADREIERARTLAKVLDNYLVDPLLGLVLPGVGDVAGSMLGLYAVILAVRRKLSPVIVARMLLNLALDAALGVIPLVGDLVDFAFRANTKNLALLETRTEHGGRATARDWAMVALAASVFAVAVVGSVYLAYRVIGALAHGCRVG